MSSTIQIATGRTVRSKVWKNTSLTWKELVGKLKEATKTNETIKDYHAANRDERGKIKDVGGYVGGYLRAGRRKPENVVYRQLITLDLDYAHLDVWDDLTLMFSNAAVLHITHSHTIENPKYRLIMPVDREVTPDEYVAISRRIAGDLGIEYFDNTGFQPYRLMFWPSVPKDLEYYCESQEGPWLNADEILASYIDWTDSTLYPTSSDYEDTVKKAVEKQQDPETKTGIIGAFCRSYSIPEAIEELLGDHYKEAGGGRYSYINGSTSGGLVVYEDKFAYSHHGTDPISGQLCNVFDLVRTHLFGILDDGSSAPTSKRPSFKAMEEFCRKDSKVKRTIAAESLNSSRYDFADDWEPEEVEATQESLEWAEELEIDGRGKYLSSAFNLNLIFTNDQRLKMAFKFDMFNGKRYVVKSLPWRKIKKPEPIKNVDYSGVRNYIETIYNIVGTSKIEDAVALEFERRAYHPVQDYLTALDWDEKPRIDTLLIDYFGAEDNAYTREAIRTMLVAAVSRIFRAGCKFDLVLTLVGEQGDGKSTFISKLGGSWFSDSFSTLHGKDAFEQLQGAWLIEMAELSGLRKADIEAIKHFITKQEDTYRPAYARSVETFPRQCVFFGTTNKRAFLSDPTGNRRFMPIDTDMRKATKVVWDMAQEEVNQIWAEAMELYSMGEPLYLSGESEAIAKKEQRRHRETDERIGIIDKYLDTLLPESWEVLDISGRRMFLDAENEVKGTVLRNYVCVAEIWAECLNKSPEDMDRYKTRELNDILRSLEDWEQLKSTKNFKIYGKQRYYARKLTM